MARLYTIVPLARGPFEGVDALARLCFGLIWDRYKLSVYNVQGSSEDSPWYDYDVDDVFCQYSQDELAFEMGVSARTVRRCLADLQEARIIRWRKVQYRGVCRYYVNQRIREYLKGQ